MKVEKNKIIKHQINNKLTPSMDWIFLDGSEVLRRKSMPVTSLTQEDTIIIDRMVSYIDACYNNQYRKLNIKPGIAVAAPQMGLNKRMIYLHFDYNDIEYRYFLINPQITSFSEVMTYIEDGEGCLSVPKDNSGYVPRNYKIIVEAYDLLTEQYVKIVAKDLLSICLQHEIDHLDGVLYKDRINKDNPKYKESNWIKI